MSRDRDDDRRRDDERGDDARGGGGGGGGGGDGGNVSLLVRNISFRTTKDELKDAFGRHGDVRDVHLPVDYYTKRPRGFAFVEFVDADGAAAALAALGERGLSLDGRDLSVLYAQQRRKRPEEMQDLDKRAGRGPPPGYRTDRSSDHLGRRGTGRYEDKYDDRRGGGRYDDRRYDDRDRGRDRDDDRRRDRGRLSDSD